MKRSKIDLRIQDAIILCNKYCFKLPIWAFWTPEEWGNAGHEVDEIRGCKLGWDITDFGMGNFSKNGLTLFTIRNGLPGRRSPLKKDYAEKILIVGNVVVGSGVPQVTPIHFHWNKMEDIINRGGGDLLMELWKADEITEGLLRTPVTVSVDGIKMVVAAGVPLVLKPGQSITLPPYLYHRFYNDPKTGVVLAGEVSRVNDDSKDNRFLEKLRRFPKIQEDKPARYVLCTEYPKARR